MAAKMVRHPGSGVALCLTMLRRESANPLRPTLLWQMTRAFFLDYFRMFHGLRISGWGNIPPSGPIIFAPNHASYFDPPLVASSASHQMRFMAWNALFRVPLFGRLIRVYGAYPVSLRSADKSAVTQTLRVLREGACVMIFPEGERTPTGELMPFEKGLARLALSVGATIVPVAVTGMNRAWPRGQAFPRPFTPVQVKFYPPIDVEKVDNVREMRDRVHQINTRLYRTLHRRCAALERLRARGRGGISRCG